MGSQARPGREGMGGSGPSFFTWGSFLRWGPFIPPPTRKVLPKASWPAPWPPLHLISHLLGQAGQEVRAPPSSPKRVVWWVRRARNKGLVGSGRRRSWVGGCEEAAGWKGGGLDRANGLPPHRPTHAPRAARRPTAAGCPGPGYAIGRAIEENGKQEGGETGWGRRGVANTLDWIAALFLWRGPAWACVGVDTQEAKLALVLVLALAWCPRARSERSGSGEHMATGFVVGANN